MLSRGCGIGVSTRWQARSMASSDSGVGLLLAGLCEGFGVGEWVLGEDGFGLCVLVGLPGEHAEGVALEPVVVESFSGVVVVDVSVGGFGGGS